MNWDLDFAGIAALLLAVITLIKTFSTTKTDKIKNKLDLAKQLQELAETATAKNVVLYERVVQLETDIVIIKSDMNLFLRLHAEWFEGITLLTDQIQRSKAQPVWTPDRTILNRLAKRYDLASSDKENT